MKYFVSYTTRDAEITRTLLENISASLQKTGEVFVDIIDNNSENKQARVINELIESDILILIDSKSTGYSEWVKIELEIAKKNKIPIIKISIEEIINFNPTYFESLIENI